MLDVDRQRAQLNAVDRYNICAAQIVVDTLLSHAPGLNLMREEGGACSGGCCGDGDGGCADYRFQWVVLSI